VGGFGSSAEAIPDPDTTPVAERSLPLSPEHSSGKVRRGYIKLIRILLVSR
jgi:hypothetical protein